MGQAIPLVQGLCELPLCIDSSVIEALEAGLSAYEGKALVNSVTGEDERLEAILPLVAKHGAAVIGLANDDEIPMEPERRVEIAKKIVSAAGDHGIPPEDVIIDPLAMPVGAEPRAVHALRRDAAPAPRRARREHDLRRRQHVVRPAGPPHARSRVPRRRAEPRPDERDHGFAPAGDGGGGPRDRLPARPRRVGRGLDPHATARSRRQRRHERGRGPPGGAAPRPRPPALPPVGRRPRRQGGARARRHDALRRGELERRRDRLDLRRPRHVQEVQGRVVSGNAPITPGRSARLHRRGAEERLAARVPRERAGGPHDRGAAAADAAEGGARRRRPARDPAAGRAEALRRAHRADARGPALGSRAGARRDGRRRAARPARGRARRSAARCARPTGR